MPGTFLVSHGAYVDDDVDTFVPNSMAVHLYADIGEAIPAPNVIEILRYRGRQSVSSIAGGAPIKNLYLTPMTQNQYETELGAVQPGETVCFLGYDAPAAGTAGFALCMGVCQPQQGFHDCPGIFGLFNGVPELHLLVCLDEMTYAPTTGEEVPDQDMSYEDNERKNLPWENQPEHYDRIAELADTISQAAGYDSASGHMATFESAEAARIFDALDYEDQTKLMTFEPVQRWSYVRYARQRLTDLGADRFTSWCNTQQDWVKDIYRKDADGVGKYVQ